MLFPRVLAIIAALSPFVMGAAATHAQTVPTPILPASLFPANLTIDYQPNVPNAVMDRTWGEDGYGKPFMHDSKEADLQRVSGWMESGSRHHGQSYMYFMIYVSTYGSLLGHAGNSAAFYDWQASVAGYWRVPLADSQPKALLPAGTSGLAETRVVKAKDGGPTVTIAGWWGATHEVEALAIFTRDNMNVTQAKRILAGMVRYAVRLPQSQTP
jgi:hypothetical protein